MPNEIITFVLYFLYSLIPLAGIMLYVALLTIEQLKEEEFLAIRDALHAQAVVTLEAANKNSETERELQEIRDSLAADGEEIDSKTKATLIMKAKLDKSSPEDISKLVSTALEAD